jgi:hypothetical protein
MLDLSKIEVGSLIQAVHSYTGKSENCFLFILFIHKFDEEFIDCDVYDAYRKRIIKNRPTHKKFWKQIS